MYNRVANRKKKHTVSGKRWYLYMSAWVQVIDTALHTNIACISLSSSPAFSSSVYCFHLFCQFPEKEVSFVLIWSYTCCMCCLIGWVNLHSSWHFQISSSLISFIFAVWVSLFLPSEDPLYFCDFSSFIFSFLFYFTDK